MVFFSFSLFALLSLEYSPHLHDQNGPFPYPCSCEQKEVEKGRHTPSSSRHNPEAAHLILAHGLLARIQSYGHTTGPCPAARELQVLEDCMST